MTLELAQFLLDRARLRPKSLSQKYWILLQDYQIVTDKQLMQYLLHSGKIGGRSQIAQCSSVRMSRRMDTSSTTKCGRIPGQTLKILYRSNEIYMYTHQQVCCWRDNSRKFYWNLDGKEYQIGNACLFIENKDYFIGYMWMAREMGAFQGMSTTDGGRSARVPNLHVCKHV